MIIVKCEKCGRLMHKAAICFSCGNTVEFSAVENKTSVHENVRTEYKMLGFYMDNRRFKDARKACDAILEWMPHCSEVFWVRMLVKFDCSTDAELLRVGGCITEQPDYINALQYADENQKKVYCGVAEKIQAVSKILAGYIHEHEYSEISKTPARKMLEEFSEQIDASRGKLIRLWNELKDTESQMQLTEKEYMLQTREYTDTVSGAYKVTDSIWYKVKNTEDCELDDYHKYSLQLEYMSSLSDEALITLKNMKNYSPLVGTYRTLVEKRDAITAEIQKEIASLRAFEEKVKAVIDAVEQIEKKHHNATAQTGNLCFLCVSHLLDKQQFNSAFTEAGIW